MLVEIERIYDQFMNRFSLIQRRCHFLLSIFFSCTTIFIFYKLFAYLKSFLNKKNASTALLFLWIIKQMFYANCTLFLASVIIVSNVSLVFFRLFSLILLILCMYCAFRLCHCFNILANLDVSNRPHTLYS